MSLQPLFLLSLPRSGSTFTQRLLSAHPKISTCPEPWLLLPLLYTLRERGSYTEYGHYLMHAGVRDLCAALAGGEAAYRETLARTALDLYGQAADAGAQYFLDKTPRYHLIAEELPVLFPQGKLIFLWRNPLAMLASIAETFGKGRWVSYVLKIDLYQGAAALVRAYQGTKNSALAVRYEDLVRQPEAELARMLDYLELEHVDLRAGFSAARIDGRLGDRDGAAAYAEISPEPLHKWRAVLGNPLRRAWCRRYLDWLGRERLTVMGYDLDELQAQLRAAPRSARYLLSDLVHMSFSPFYPLIEAGILRDKWRDFRAHRRAHAHR